MLKFDDDIFICINTDFLHIMSLKKQLKSSASVTYVHSTEAVFTDSSLQSIFTNYT